MELDQRHFIKTALFKCGPTHGQADRQALDFAPVYSQAISAILKWQWKAVARSVCNYA
jgi:hypothetical protein